MTNADRLRQFPVILGSKRVRQTFGDSAEGKRRMRGNICPAALRGHLGLADHGRQSEPEEQIGRRII